MIVCPVCLTVPSTIPATIPPMERSTEVPVTTCKVAPVSAQMSGPPTRSAAQGRQPPRVERVSSVAVVGVGHAHAVPSRRGAQLDIGACENVGANQQRGGQVDRVVAT